MFNTAALALTTPLLGSFALLLYLASLLLFLLEAAPRRFGAGSTQARMFFWLVALRCPEATLRPPCRLNSLRTASSAAVLKNEKQQRKFFSIEEMLYHSAWTK